MDHYLQFALSHVLLFNYRFFTPCIVIGRSILLLNLPWYQIYNNQGVSNVNWNIKCNFCFVLLSIPRQRQQVRTGAKFGTRDSWKTRNGVAVQANKRVEYTRGGGHLFRRQSFSVPSHICYRRRCIEPIPIRLGAICGI